MVASHSDQRIPGHRRPGAAALGQQQFAAGACGGSRLRRPAAQMQAGEAAFKTDVHGLPPGGRQGPAGRLPAARRFRLSCSATRPGRSHNVVNGLQGEVVINGAKYDSVMPAMTQLSDQQIADALTYAMN